MPERVLGVYGRHATLTVLPYDILPHIIEQFSKERDLCNLAVVSRAFNRAVTPVLYRNLDILDTLTVRNSKNKLVRHPAITLLDRPELALYVRSVVESGTLHNHPQCQAQRVLPLALRALALCKNLYAFTWQGDGFIQDSMLAAFLDVLRTLPVRSITIHTFRDLGKDAWDRLHQFTTLERVSIWCMEGPPRVLQGWAEHLGATLTHLTLGRCSGVPATILISVFAHLRMLTQLNIRGAPSNAIPIFLPSLPMLTTLDTDYNATGPTRPRHNPGAPAMPRLHTLTVRMSSVDNGGPRESQFWMWIRQLAPACSLRELALRTFATLGETSVPRGLILWLAQVHSRTMTVFDVDTAQVALPDLRCLCDELPLLEELSCAVANPDARIISDVTSQAFNLRCLRLHVQWFQRVQTTASHPPFTVEDAEAMMLRENSRLRLITVGPVKYKGQWELGTAEHAATTHFEVSKTHIQNERTTT